KRTFAAQMMICAWSVVIALYYVSAYLLHGISQPVDVINWAASNPSLLAPLLNPIPGVIQSPRTNIDLIIGHSVTLFRTSGGVFEWASALAAVIAGFLFLLKVMRNTTPTRLYRGFRRIAARMAGPRKQLYLVIVFWITPYMIFLCFFEPQDPYLRLFYA